MVSSKQAMESEYITADLVKESKTKVLVVLEGGEYQKVVFDGKESEKLTLPVEIDGARKTWRPNRDSVKNLNRGFGEPTEDWVGKPVSLDVVSIAGKDSVIATPKK